MSTKQYILNQVKAEGARVEDIPELDTMEEWYREDGGCEATDGCWVEVDGTCEHGKRSWLLVLGLA